METWQKEKAALLQLGPGSPGYLPYPFPVSREQLSRDFRTGFLDYEKGVKSVERLPPWERRLYRIVRDDAFDLDVIEIVNWNESLCVSRFEDRKYFMLRVFPAGSEEEVARVIIKQSGHMVSWLFADTLKTPADRAAWASSLPSLEAVKARVAESSPLRGEVSASYVTAYTAPASGLCQVMKPCVVVTSAEGAHLFVPMAHGPNDLILALSREPTSQKPQPGLGGPGPLEPGAAVRFVSFGPGLWFDVQGVSVRARGK